MRWEEHVTDSTFRLPAKIEPSQVTVVVDTREQLPLDLSPLRSEVGTLASGDYTIRGCEHIVRVERKSLDDLLGCVGRERDRFEREVQRLLAFPLRFLVVESTWQALELGQWRGKVTSSQVVGSLIGWQADGLSIHMAGDHQRAGRHVSRLLYTIARRRYRELRTMFSAQEVTAE